MATDSVQQQQPQHLLSSGSLCFLLSLCCSRSQECAAAFCCCCWLSVFSFATAYRISVAFSTKCGNKFFHFGFGSGQPPTCFAVPFSTIQLTYKSISELCIFFISFCVFVNLAAIALHSPIAPAAIQSMPQPSVPKTSVPALLTMLSLD